MTETLLNKSLINVATFIGLAVPLVGLGMYVNNLTNQIDTSKVEVAALKAQVGQLQDILERAQQSATEGRRGPKGDKGDRGESGEKGDQGPRGERGPQGERGTDGQGVSLEQIRQLVTTVAAEKFASLPSSAGISTIVDAGGTFDLTRCLLSDDVKKTPVITVRKGTEICANDGSLIATFSEIGRDDVIIQWPGRYGSACSRTNSCSFEFDKGRTFTVERITEDENGAVASLRFKSRN